MTARRPSPRRSSEYAWLVTGPLAFFALVCLIAFWVHDPDWYRLWPGGLAAVVALLAAHFTVLNVVVRRQSITVGVTEIPMVLALFFLPPTMVILAVTIAQFLSLLRTRIVMTKLWFNVAMSAAGASLALLVITALPRMTDAGPGTWGTLAAAVMASSVLTYGSIAAVIAVTQGRHAGLEAIRSALAPQISAAVNVAIGLVFLIALVYTKWAALLLAILVAALSLIIRSVTEFFRQHRTLADVYELTLAVREQGTDGGLPDVLLGRVRALMRSEYATLWLPAQGRHPEVLLSARVDDDSLLDISPTPAVVRGFGSVIET